MHRHQQTRDKLALQAVLEGFAGRFGRKARRTVSRLGGLRGRALSSRVRRPAQ